MSSAIDLRPDESLISAMMRTTAKNHLPRVSRLLGEANGVYHSFVNLAAREGIDFDQLAWTARLPPHDVETRRYRPTMIHATLPGIDFHGAIVPAYDLRLKTRRIAPSWLREDPYHSAIGHHLAVPHCPATGEIMIEECPRCQTSLNWSQIDMTRCQTCDLDLATLDGQNITEMKRQGASLMADIIHPHPARHLAAVGRLPAALSSLNRGVVFELGWRLGSILVGQGFRDRDNVRHLPVETRLDIMLCGSDILEDWPSSLVNAVTGRVQLGAAMAVGNPIGQIRHLVAYRSAWPDHRRLLFDVIPGMKRSNAAAVKLALVAGGNAAETTRALGVGQTVFERLRASKHLTPVLAGGTENLHQIFDVSDRSEMIQRFADKAGINSVSEQLGIGRHGAEQLCCMGILNLLDEGFMRDAYVERQIVRTGFEKLISTLENGATSIGEDERIPIMQAVRIIGGREKPWATIIDAMICSDPRHRLEYHLDEQCRWAFMTRVNVRSEDVLRIADMHFDHKVYVQFEFAARMPRRDAERLLNVTPKYMDVAIANGEIRREADGLFDREHVRGLAQKFISGGEILMRWVGEGKKKPAQFRGRRKLERVGALGWLRAEVEKRMMHEPPRVNFVNRW